MQTAAIAQRRRSARWMSGSAWMLKADGDAAFQEALLGGRQRAVDGGEQVFDLAPDRRQQTDGNHRHKSGNKRVLDHRYPCLVPPKLPRQPKHEKLLLKLVVRLASILPQT